MADELGVCCDVSRNIANKQIWVILTTLTMA